MQKSVHCQAEISHKDVTLTSANFHISLPLLLGRELPRHRRIFAVWVLWRKGPKSTSNWDNTLVVVIKKIVINRNKFLNLVAVATKFKRVRRHSGKWSFVWRVHLENLCFFRAWDLSLTLPPTPSSGQDSGPFKWVLEPSRKLIQWPLTLFKKSFQSPEDFPLVWTTCFKRTDWIFSLSLWRHPVQQQQQFNWSTAADGLKKNKLNAEDLSADTRQLHRSDFSSGIKLLHLTASLLKRHQDSTTNQLPFTSNQEVTAAAKHHRGRQRR